MTGLERGLAGHPRAPVASPALIQKVILGGDQAVVSFRGIPQTFDHLRVLMVVRDNLSVANIVSFSMRVNDDSAAVYSIFLFQPASASTLQGFESLTQTHGRIGRCPATTGAAGRSAQLIVDLPNYTSREHAKMWTTQCFSPEGSGTGGYQLEEVGGIYDVKAPIRSLAFSPNAFAGAVMARSAFWLYGI